MLTLREFQERFSASLFSHADPDPALASLIEPNGLSAARRVGIYRNNVNTSLEASLAATYPAIQALVGEDFFRMLARRYLQAHPSRSGDLHQFGDHFDDFVRDDPDAARLPWMADLARLEWAYHRVFHAAEAQAVASASLAQYDESEHERLCLRLHPASALIASVSPVTAIWRLGVHGNASSGNVDLDTGPEYVLVARRNLEMTFQSLSGVEHAFVKAMAADHPLGACVAAAFDVDESFDAGECLARQFALGNISGVSVADAPGEVNDTD